MNHIGDINSLRWGFNTVFTKKSDISTAKQGQNYRGMMSKLIQKTQSVSWQKIKIDRALKLRLIRFTLKERNSSQLNCVTQRKVASKEIRKTSNLIIICQICLKSCLIAAKNIHEIYCRSRNKTWRKFVPSYINVRSTVKKITWIWTSVLH